MNSINNTPNNINFTAKMELNPSLVTRHAKRLKNIAETFEAKTQKYPSDVFEIRGSEADGGFNIYQYDKGFEHENCCDIDPKSWDKLLEKSDEYVTNKLVKLFKLFKKKDAEYEKAGKYISSVMKKEKNNDPTDFESKFWDILVDKANADLQIATGKDNVMKDWRVY